MDLVIGEKDMSDMASVMIVDDDEVMRLLLENALAEHYRVVVVSSGEECLAACARKRPDIILLDVEMPGLDGYDTCRQIKAAGDEAPPVVFISNRDRLEDRLRGYEAGGEEYILKPVEPAELQRKVGVVLRYLSKNTELMAQANGASSVAMAALESAADASRILSFLREISGMNGFSDIAETTLRTLGEYGLDARIQLRTRNGTLSRNLEGQCSPLEESVLTTMATCARIVDLGRRSAFNYPHVSIIVNNMPRADSDQYGRMKDNVTKFTEAVDIHMQSLELTLDSINRGDTLLGLLQRNAKTLREIEARYDVQRRKSADILNHLVNEIEGSFYFMGLTDNQERHLQDLARNAVEMNQALYDESIETDAIMRSLGEGLDATLQQELKGAAGSASEDVRFELF